MDALVIGGSVRRPVRFVMDHNIFKIPVMGFIFRTARAIPIAPAREDPDALDEAFDRIDAELADGEIVCIFPEGKLTRDGEMNEFKRGVERILERRAVPVVPMALRGLWGSFFSHRDGKTAMSQTAETLLVAHRAGRNGTRARCRRQRRKPAAHRRRPACRVAVTLLKSDTFGTISRVGDTVVRDAGAARPWARRLAMHLMRREHRALTRLALGAGIAGVPRVLDYAPDRLTRSWIDGAPMQVAQPRDPAYFRAAARLIRRLHTANVIHNDLAKETNWLVTPDGRPALVDFQLAMILTARGPLARALGHDDIRHLLKHKRTYLPERLTVRERRILATPSLVSRVWMASGKKVYLFITRKVFRWRDREGAGDRGASPGH